MGLSFYLFTVVSNFVQQLGQILKLSDFRIKISYLKQFYRFLNSLTDFLIDFYVIILFFL
jgi:hypothetical protein